MMKNKKAKVATWIVVLILMIVVVVIGAFAWGTLLGGSPLDIFGGFTPNEVVIEYDGRETLLYPTFVNYILDGKNFNMKFNYDTGNGEYKKGWHWKERDLKGFYGFRKMVDITNWVHVNTTLSASKYSKLSEVEKRAIGSLRSNISPEEGLRRLVHRAIATKYEFIVEIVAEKVRAKPLHYEYTDGRLKDINGLIIKINQISRGVVNEARSLR